MFVVGHCSDARGQLQLEAPIQEGLFVVRRGNEDQFSLGLRRWRRLWMLSSWGFSGLSLALVLAALRS